MRPGQWVISGAVFFDIFVGVVPLCVVIKYHSQSRLHDRGHDMSLNIPEGLCSAGEKAARAIVELLEARGATYTGGCPAFYSPETHGEWYGDAAVLVVCYENNDLTTHLDIATHCAESYQAMVKMLEFVGCWHENINCSVSVIYAFEVD